MQRCLGKASELLAAQGVRYYGPQYFCQRRHAIHGLFGLRPAPNPNVAKRSPADQLAIMRKDAHRLVFSEENFIGPLNDPLGQRIERRYALARSHLAALAQALNHEMDIFISVHRPTAYLNSAYCQMLLGGLVRPFNEFSASYPLGSIDWCDLITQVCAAKGVGRVVVWRYEDYAPLFPQIVAEIVGQDMASLVPWVTRNINTGLSAEAVARVLAHRAEEAATKLAFTARGALPVAPDRPAFDGYSAAEHAQGDAIYKTQLAAIAEMEGVTLLSPAPS